MLSGMLAEYKKNNGSVNNFFLNCHAFIDTLETLALETLGYYINIHGIKASQWADVYLKLDVFTDACPFILIDIPTDLSGRYTLMPLCNSQRRFYANGTDTIVR